MILDAILPPIDLTEAPAVARAAEGLGFGALWCAEMIHDPFLQCALISTNTHNIQFGTAIAVAFARSPTTLAYTAWDLAKASGGRFILGLGTQVRAHITRRFGMPWPDSVTGQLRDQIGAMRALWYSWQSGAPLNYSGSHYHLTLMTPFFNPGAIDHPHIPIYLAGVNAGMARLAGELVEGFLVHPLHSPAYLRQVMLPALREGAEKSSRNVADVAVSATVMAATTPEEEDSIRLQVAFYASTPSYRPVLTLHGWGDIGDRLAALAHAQAWSDMPALVSDEMLRTFCVVCPAVDLPDVIKDRYSGLAQRVSLYLPFVPGERDDFWRFVVSHVS
jgi:probable F420-dependent oxidoreductase